MRLVSPLSAESRYASALERGPGVHSFAVRVPDLDAALGALERDGVRTIYRHGRLAASEPTDTLGIYGLD
jgi:hypothetical protein